MNSKADAITWAIVAMVFALTAVASHDFGVRAAKAEFFEGCLFENAIMHNGREIKCAMLAAKPKRKPGSYVL
jgi:hypothetical protein